MTTERLLQFCGVVAVPLLLATSSSIFYAFSVAADHSASDAVTEQRLLSVERAVVEQARSARVIEATVTRMQIDQASFVSSVSTRVGSLETRSAAR